MYVSWMYRARGQLQRVILESVLTLSAMPWRFLSWMPYDLSAIDFLKNQRFETPMYKGVLIKFPNKLRHLT